MLFRAIRYWGNLSLITRFMGLTVIATVGVMLLVGHWVTGRIAKGVVDTSANASAQYTDAFIGPNVQELASEPRLSEASIANLDKLLQPQISRNQIASVRVWYGETIVYSDNKSLIGVTYPPDEDHQKAARGTVTANFQSAHYTSHAPPGLVGLPVLELHAPIFQTDSRRVIGIVEVYELASGLADELWRARVGTWLIVVGATAALIALQLMIVLAGSRTIDRQRINLEQQVGRLSVLLDENTELRKRMSEANGRVSTMNDRFLRSLGADLHDGPVQYLGIAMLRLGSLAETVELDEFIDAREAREDISVLQDTLSEAIRELRHISAGLSLPEIDNLSPAALLENVANRHERRTHTAVERRFEALPTDLPSDVKGCIYRLAQEGLTNAFRHADGNGQSIEAAVEGEVLEVRILDRGPTHPVTLTADHAPYQQGLLGLRDRVEALGATLEVSTRIGGGTRLTGRFSIVTDERRELAHA